MFQPRRASRACGCRRGRAVLARRGRKLIASIRASPVEALYDQLEALSPQSEAQRAMPSQALSTAADVGRTRVAAVREFGQFDPRTIRRDAGVLAVHHLCKLRSVHAAKRNRDGCPLRLCTL